MSDPIIEEIKQKLDIVDVVNQYIPLKRSGTHFKAPCPFHHEKTPSFMVNRERQLYRCFGCGESGDIFAFVMKQENIDFATALQLLADKAGVTLPEKTTSRRSSGIKKTDLYEVNNIATRYFHHILTKHALGKPALDYLHGRGVTDESIERFQIGFAPNHSAPLLTLFQKKELTPPLVKAAGNPDRFRDRIMFPFLDVVGNGVGFSGRALGDAVPKYLNTAETELFHKNRYLYGLWLAKKAFTTAGKVMMVEGQLDLVLAHQAGAAYTVATSGTALTNDHLALLRRYCDVVYFAFDGDTAGKKATERAIALAIPHGFDVSVIPLPDGSDPGELIARDLPAWEQLLTNSLPAIDWLLSYYFPESRSTKPSTTERQKLFDAIFPYVRLQDDTVSRSYALQRLALALGVPEKVMVEAFEAWNGKVAPSTVATSEKTESKMREVKEPIQPLDEWQRKERSIIGLLLIRPELLQHAELRLPEEGITHPALQRLYTTILSWYNKNTTESSPTLIYYVEATLRDGAKQALHKLIFDTETYVADFAPEQFLEEYTLLIHMLRQRKREERIQSYAQQIAEAEANHDRARVLELMQHMQQALKTKERYAQENS